MVVPTDIYRVDIPPPLSKISTVSVVGACVCIFQRGAFMDLLPALETVNHLNAIFTTNNLLLLWNMSKERREEGKKNVQISLVQPSSFFLFHIIWH